MLLAESHKCCVAGSFIGSSQQNWKRDNRTPVECRKYRGPVANLSQGTPSNPCHKVATKCLAVVVVAQFAQVTFTSKPANARRQPGRLRQRYGRCIMPVRQKLEAKPGSSSHVFRSHETKAI